MLMMLALLVLWERAVWLMLMMLDLLAACVTALPS